MSKNCDYFFNIFQKYPFDLEIDFEMLHSIYDTVNS